MIQYKISLSLILFLFTIKQNTAVEPVIKDRLVTSTSSHLEGYLGRRLDSSYQNRILAQNVDRLISPFRQRTETSCWQSEFWGKWFTSAVLAYKYKPELILKNKLDQAVAGLLQTQSADGYIGNYADDKHLQSWDIWGRKYCMLGLLAYYDLTQDKNTLNAASRIADHLMLELKDKNAMLVKMGNHRGMAASSILEPMCLLYSKTGEKKYFEFAQEIIRQWETPDGPQLISKANVDVANRFPKPDKNWYGWNQGQKAYEMMSCYEGLLELYRLTGKLEYKQAVEQTWTNIRETEINIAGSGASVECWFHGKEHQTEPVYHYQETCVTATWIKLSQQLLRLTGEAKYADAIEQTYYNALLGAMRRDGSDWAKYTPLSGQRLEGTEQCGMGLNCCNASGPRALFTLPFTAMMQYQEGIQINFYEDGKYNLKSPKGAEVQLIQKTNYPESGKIDLQLEIPTPESMGIRFRIPDWCSVYSIFLNEERIEIKPVGQIGEINRIWKKGDKIRIELEMKGRLIRQGINPAHLAITYGPLVLARDERLSGPSLENIITPVSKHETEIFLKPVLRIHPDVWLRFAAEFIPESYAEGGGKPVTIELCDYASAGNSNQGLPHFKVWLPQLYDPRK